MQFHERFLNDVLGDGEVAGEALGVNSTGATRERQRAAPGSRARSARLDLVSSVPCPAHHHAERFVPSSNPGVRVAREHRSLPLRHVTTRFIRRKMGVNAPGQRGGEEITAEALRRRGRKRQGPEWTSHGWNTDKTRMQEEDNLEGSHADRKGKVK